MPLTDSQVDAAASELLAARDERRRLVALDPTHRPADVADGYRVQWAGHRLRGAGLGPWKVGATSAAAQAALGVDGPFLGRPEAERVLASGTTLVLDEWFTGPPVIEIEVGLRPLTDLTTLPDDPLELAGSVEFVACIELVNSRYADMGAVGAPSLVADNAVASVILTEAGSTDDVGTIRALDTAPVTLDVDGVRIAKGTGADALGHPLRVLHFAAGLALEQGRLIEAGQLVITGTCTGVVDGTAGQHVLGTIGDRTVEVTFA